MPKKCSITLISKATGGKHHFNSMTNAAMFLHRAATYFKNKKYYGGEITDAITKEAYIMVKEKP